MQLRVITFTLFPWSSTSPEFGISGVEEFGKKCRAAGIKKRPAIDAFKRGRKRWEG